jgi:nucleotide-binding universal stress UspA family protein
VFGKVLVPLDGSAFAEAALPLACAVSRRSGGELGLVTVHEPVPAFAQADWEASAREWSEHYLQEVERRLDVSGCSTATTVLSGSVAGQLEARAQETGANLLVMATHGRGPLTRAWLGSVADHFVRHSPCPVMLVTPSSDEVVDLEGELDVTRILVPLDGSEFSETVLDHTAKLAALFDASLTLVQVIAYPLEIASPYLPHTVQMNQKVVEDAKATAVAHLEQIAANLREDGLEVDSLALVDTQAGHGILQAADQVGADMIAMATHARSGVSRAFLGSTADKVVRGAHRPVFLYRPGRH